MHMNLKKLLPAVLATLLFFPAFAQEKKAAIISGTVKDARSKSPLNEVVVTLSSTAFQGQKFALTDSTGMYRIGNLPAGNYTISFEMEGYEKFTQENIALQEGMSLGVSFQMVKERSRRRN
ncbi:MAG: TonB-dependent receptor [Segetibacter sp.]|nr:TonB-dependent receptor [Segetibacter sp.]